MKFHIITLGCKVNTYESEAIKEDLIQNNFIYEEKDEFADIIIINTCSVTNIADNKSKKMVRHGKRLGKILVVCGCSSENKQEEYKQMGIDILIGNREKNKITTILKSYQKGKKPYVSFYKENNCPFEEMQVKKFSSHTRAFVKIQEGCNNYCSYCIIPYVRKNVRSKNFKKTIEEIKLLVENGHKEIVLTGILTGSYLSENHTLKDLLHEISQISGLERIRISSIEITELNEELLEEIKTNSKIVNHLHIPLQAGSDEILKRMNRKYNISYFKKKIEEIRKYKEDISITTDVIVGHPYETEELFLETVKNCEEIGFSKIHVFPYSKRDGTPSSKMPYQVDEVTKKMRSRYLNQVSKKLEKDFYIRHLEQTVDVLIEETFENSSVGFTTNYIKVEIKEKLKRNEIYRIKLKDYEENKLIGENEIENCIIF